MAKRKICPKCEKIFERGNTIRIIEEKEYCNMCDNPPIKLIYEDKLEEIKQEAHIHAFKKATKAVNKR